MNSRVKIALFAVVFGLVASSFLIYSRAQGQLAYSPPELTNPITINLGTGKTSTTLDDNKDYILKLPSSKKVGATTIIGGRNVVIIGGHITIPTGGQYDSDKRAIYVKDGPNTQVGRTVHIEGILIDGSGGGDSDGIAIAAPKTIVQIQNVRIVGLTGSQSGYHNDVVQPWGGVKELRIDRLTGSTNYQGFQIPKDLAPIEKAEISNVNLSYTNQPPADGGYMIWLAHRCNTYPVKLTNVYVVPKSGRSLGKSVWPDEDDSSCPVNVTNNVATWPTLPHISGSVIGGSPSGGDFVPSGVAGVGYVSPGYGVGTNPPPVETPKVTFITPSDGQVISGAIRPEATATHSSGIAQTDFYLDGTYVRTEKSPPYCMQGDDGTCFELDTTTLANGQHEFKVTVVAKDGSVATSAIKVTVQNGTSNPEPTPEPEPTPPPSVSTVIFNGNLKKYSMDSHEFNISNTGEVLLDLTWTKSGDFDLHVYDKEGSEVYSVNYIVKSPFKVRFDASSKGPHTINITTNSWRPTPYTLIVTHP